MGFLWGCVSDFFGGWFWLCGWYVTKGYFFEGWSVVCGYRVRYVACVSVFLDRVLVSGEV